MILNENMLARQTFATYLRNNVAEVICLTSVESQGVKNILATTDENHLYSMEICMISLKKER